MKKIERVIQKYTTAHQAIEAARRTLPSVRTQQKVVLGRVILASDRQPVIVIKSPLTLEQAGILRDWLVEILAED